MTVCVVMWSRNSKILWLPWDVIRAAWASRRRRRRRELPTLTLTKPWRSQPRDQHLFRGQRYKWVIGVVVWETSLPLRIRKLREVKLLPGATEQNLGR